MNTCIVLPTPILGFVAMLMALMIVAQIAFVAAILSVVYKRRGP